MIKVILADNHPLFLEGMKSSFKKSGIETLAEVTNKTDLEIALKGYSPNVVVLDLNLKGLDKLSELKSMKKSYPSVEFVIFSDNLEESFGSLVSTHGAIGYVHKSSNIQTLKKAIKDANEKVRTFSEFTEFQLTSTGKEFNEQRSHKRLSRRELEVLNLLSQGKRNKDVAKELALDEKTISTYKLRLLTKLNANEIVSLIDKAKKLGLVK